MINLKLILTSAMLIHIYIIVLHHIKHLKMQLC